MGHLPICSRLSTVHIKKGHKLYDYRCRHKSMSTYHVMYSDHLQSKTQSTQNGHFFEVVSHCLLLAKKTFFA